MNDFRKAERELVHLLDAAGVDIVYQSGDAYAVVASIPRCGSPIACRAGIGPYGKTECFDCGIEVNLNATLTTINITELAVRLAG